MLEYKFIHPFPAILVKGHLGLEFRPRAFCIGAWMMRLWNPRFWIVCTLKWGTCHIVFPYFEFYSRHYFKNITLLLTLKVSRNRCYLWNLKMYERHRRMYNILAIYRKCVKTIHKHFHLSLLWIHLFSCWKSSRELRAYTSK